MPGRDRENVARARAGGDGGIIGPRPGADKFALLLLGGSALCYASATTFARDPSRIAVWIAIYGLAWFAYLLLCTRERIPGAAQLLCVALLFRLLLLPAGPWLSDDVHRYLLDGHALAAGINPYRHAPSDPELRDLAPELAARVNHPQLPTIYPPMVPLVSAAVVKAGGGVLAWRLLMSLCDLATMALVARLFSSWRAAAVFGLCPLAVFESAGNGHLEAMLMLGFVAAVERSRARSLARALLPWTVASLTKYLPLLVLPLWLRDRRAMLAGVGIVAAVGVVLWPFGRHGVDPFHSLRVYLSEWIFNAPIFELARGLGVPQLPLRALPFVVLTAGLAIARWRRVEPLVALPRLLFAFLVCGATLHPWYALWVLPWLGARPHRGLWAFVGAMGLAYAVWWQVEHEGVWRLAPWQSVGLWSIVLLGWALEWRRRSEEPQKALRDARDGCVVE